MNNGFFGAAMRSLGFKVKMAAARVAKGIVWVRKGCLMGGII